MDNLLNKKVNIKRDNNLIFIGILKQSLSLEYYVVIDDDDDSNRFVILKDDDSFIIEPFKMK
jgi:hypothetical protein